jgi:diguanylate cyclase (GGDEF)-like protein/PAS domain S-box-containing protein
MKSSPELTKVKLLQKEPSLRPKLHLLYYLLATFDVFAILTSLNLNHRMMSIYTHSIEVNRVWNERLADYSKLGQLVAVVNAPGNDVFDSQNVKGESEKMYQAQESFKNKIVALQMELQSSGSSAELAPLLNDLQAVSTTMDEMTNEANLIFSYFKQGQSQKAGQRMATMDRKYAKVNTALARLRNRVSNIQEENFRNQAMLAVSLQKLEYVIAVFALLMVSGATIYGHKIAKKMELDAQEKERSIKDLQAAEARTRSILDTARDGIVTFDKHGIIESLNPSIDQIFGYSVQELTGRNVEILMPQLYQEENNKSFINDLLTLKLESTGVGREVVGRCKNGTTFPLELAVSEMYLDEQPVFTAIIRDITERKAVEQKLVHDAFHDKLTALPNRALFMARLEQAVEQRKRCASGLFALLFIDLDRFKLINDSLGHIIGDQLLISIAQRLQACLRPGDTVARLGGDEFAILVENLKETNEVIQLASRVHKKLSLAFNLNGHQVFATASIGITLSTNTSNKAEDLLREADTAMYSAKARGKACHDLFDRDMHDRALTRLQLETDLQQAIERQEFQVYYQPIVLLETGKITGFEGLVRWKHPLRGFIAPDQFISVAEETGLILPLGQWVLREACHQMRAWQIQFPRNKPLTISVNVSAKQLMQPNLTGQVAQILHETNLDARSLKLELTESVLMENTESVTAVMQQLKVLGVSLSLDDFGTGYSSLSYLHRFPIDTLKIDRSFVNKMTCGDKNLEIIRAIIMLSQALGMDVVAEGIETADQLAQLSQLQCKYGQGYFFFKPLDGATAGASIAQNLDDMDIHSVVPFSGKKNITPAT